MDELRKKISASDSTIRSAADAIVRYSRSLIPTLKDAGREHAARELDRLIFEYDAAVGEAANLFRDNIDGILEIFKGHKP